MMGYRVKSIVLVAVLSFLSIVSFSQGMFGFQAGYGRGFSYSPEFTPAFHSYYLAKLTPRFYVGGAISFQRYSFKNTIVTDTNNLSYGETLGIHQKSSFLFFCPEIDFGIGYRKYIHANLSFGPGIAVEKYQMTSQYQPFWTTPGGGSYGADTVAANTAYNIPNVIFRIGFGLTERVPSFKFWNLIFTEEYSMIPGYISKGSPNLSTGYFCVMVGIMHKYPQVFVEY